MNELDNLNAMNAGMQTPELPKQPYMGPGKLVSSLGTSQAWSWPGAAVMMGGLLAMMPSFLKFSQKTNGMHYGHEFEQAAKTFANETKTSRKFVYFGIGATLIGSLLGYVRGWNSAKLGEAQYNDMQDQRDAAMANAKITGLQAMAMQNEMGALQGEVMQHRQKLFTDTIKSKHEHPEHAGVHPDAITPPTGEEPKKPEHVKPEHEKPVHEKHETPAVPPVTGTEAPAGELPAHAAKEHASAEHPAHKDHAAEHSTETAIKHADAIASKPTSFADQLAAKAPVAEGLAAKVEQDKAAKADMPMQMA